MNEINNTLVEETLTSLRRFAAIKSQIDVATEIDKAINTIKLSSRTIGTTNKTRTKRIKCNRYISTISRRSI